MPRYYNPRGKAYDPEADDPRERDSPKNKPTWKTWLKWIGIGILAIIFLLFILSATGNLKSKNNTDLNATGNYTENPTQLEQLTTYIIAQQNAGMSKEEIVQRLTLAGFSPQDIETAYQLSNPIAQYILKAEKEGQTRQQIVESLLAQGITPEEIQANYDLIDSTKSSSLGDTLKKNWFWILLAAIIIYFIWKNVKQDQEEKKLMPKVYTLDECEEYAREYLSNKGKPFNPSKQYRNRPDIRQYRFVYEEPLYPEFNDHLPTGHRIGHRLYYLIAIGYDREVIDYLETHDDNRINPFLYGAPKSFEQVGAKEYMGLRRTSEQPIEERKPGEQQGTPGTPGYGEYGGYSGYGAYRPRTYRRYPRVRPGPVTGYERP